MQKVVLFCCWSLGAMLAIGCVAQTQEIEKRPAHHTDDGFKNLYVDDPDKSFFDFLKMRFFGDEPWADHPSLAHTVPTVSLSPERLTNPTENLQITWLGHSMFLLQYKGINILTDPIFAERASPYSFAGPKRYIPHAIDYKALPPIDIVVISHNHYDHLDENTLVSLADTATFYVPLNNGDLLRELGISSQKIIELDWQESVSHQGIDIQALPSQHWSARGLFDRLEALWASWSIKIADKHLWFAGDTGYNDIQFKAIGDLHTDINVALIPIGAYAPRWFMKTYHVNPAEAVKIHQDVGARLSIGMHWGTFPLTAETPSAPLAALSEALSANALADDSFITMAVGQVLEIE